MTAFYLSLDTTEPPWDLLLVKGDIKQFVEPCVSSDRFREISRAVPGRSATFKPCIWTRLGVHEVAGVIAGCIAKTEFAQRSA